MSNILIGVTGGIAAYKIPLLCRKFIQNGDSVKVILTENAAKFVTPITLETLTKNRVYIDDFKVDVSPKDIEHIDLATWADLFIIAPATANTIAKIAYGIADNLLTSTILAYEKNKPVYICPAMNTNMYINPITTDNINKLKDRGFVIIPPVEGELACKDVGIGKMQEPDKIFEFVLSSLTKGQILKGKKVIVTAGPTVEDIDPVRYISNRSSGKMGYSLAETAKKFGAEVLLVSGPVNIKTSLPIVHVKSAVEMLTVLKDKIFDYDILIMAAAVADYRVENVSVEKIKKDGDELLIKLVKNPDILTELSKLKKEGQIFVGFAAESNDLERYAKDKLERKKLDMIVANDISRKDIAFDSDFNEVFVFKKDGSKKHILKERKEKISEIILSEIVEYLQ
ncbi:bifunctional phosphopantothenoylcysteine decarboxylase/phosphopantothenate--cysteine ligase CoaBC [Deferribacteraceae bacterium V6Fe1]|nr:bifunctional phosphopantothenoylcysteine decarboxylase/phosphopantothenate--cysteine ligase CoaBC [Deferribacteraceae bacterium V6Fe1]